MPPTLRAYVNLLKRIRTLMDLFLILRDTIARNLLRFMGAEVRHGFARRRGSVEPKVGRLIQSLRGRVFIDIGANVGYYTLLAAPHFKDIVAVEPHPDLARRIREAADARRMTNIEVVQVAVGDRSGTAELMLVADHPHNAGVIEGTWTMMGRGIAPNVLQNQPAQKFFTPPVPVDVIPFTDLINKYGEADAVKIDVEGAEFLILANAATVMSKVTAWVVELHDRARKGELEKIFRVNGYRSRWIDGSHIYAWRGPMSHSGSSG